MNGLGSPKRSRSRSGSVGRAKLTKEEKLELQKQKSDAKDLKNQEKAAKKEEKDAKRAEKLNIS